MVTAFAYCIENKYGKTLDCMVQPSLEIILILNKLFMLNLY